VLKDPTDFQEEISFYFSRSKGTHEEAGEQFITLFARLSVIIPSNEKEAETSGHQTLWVDIDQVKEQQATLKTRKMPDFIQQYEVPEALFWELYKISQRCPDELYYLTPLSHLHDYSNRS
jgi:hypothetical protein